MLGSVSPEVAAAALRRLARQEGAEALRLLRGLLELAPGPAVVAAALEALGEVALPEAAELATRWAYEDAGAAPGASETPAPLGGSAVGGASGTGASGTGASGNSSFGGGAFGGSAIRKAARRALHRLSQAGVQPVPRAAPIPAGAAERPERVRRAAMSAADSEGTRLLYLLIDPPLGGAQLARVIASESLGLLRFEVRDSTGRQFERYLAGERPDRELALADVPAPYARWLIGEAVAASQAKGQALPASFLSFRDALAPPDFVPIPPIEDDPLYLEVRYRPDLAEQSVELVELPEFALWLPAPERVAPLAAEWRAAGAGQLTLPPAVLAQRRDAILDRVVDLVAGPGGVAGARRRLEDNALVLLRKGETQAARRAVAAAMRLDPDNEGAARAHPLFRAVAQRAIESLVGPEEPPQPAPLAPLPPAASLAPGPATEATAEPTQATETDDGLRRRPSGLILPR